MENLLKMPGVIAASATPQGRQKLQALLPAATQRTQALRAASFPTFLDVFGQNILKISWKSL